MSLRISRILHAGYVFEADQTKIVFDPIFENPFSRNCFAFPNVEFDRETIRRLRFDAIFISHFHDDHCSLESLDLLHRETPIFFYCHYPEFFQLIRDLGFTDVRPLIPDQTVTIGPIEVTARRALDEEVDSLFQIRTKGVNVLNVVDSWIDDETIQKLVGEGPWDMVLWPFQTMREIEVLAPTRIPEDAVAVGTLPSEWANQLQKLRPRYVVPSSCQFIHEAWSWYNRSLFPITYKFFESEVIRLLPEAQAVRLNPSVSIRLSNAGLESDDPLSWVKPLGDQDVDYEFDPSASPPSVGEISAHFKRPLAAECLRVWAFCEQGLLDRYRSLEAPNTVYFEKPRRWVLRVHDGRDSSRDFSYIVLRDQISIDRSCDEPVGWMTEIPISKIFAALEDGESLTSLYLRINDVKFSDQIEVEMGEVDIVLDPLVRTLYSGDIGGYQAAQLKRIKKRAEKIET